jgi:hypothetical protein
MKRIEEIVEDLISEIPADNGYHRYVHEGTTNVIIDLDESDDWLDRVRVARRCRRSTRIRTEDIS